MSAAEPRLLMSLARRSGPLESVLIHPGGGGLGQYLGVASHLARHGTVHGIRAAGLLPEEEPDDSVPEMTRKYLGLLAGLPRRPGLLVGWSLGGVLAWELAARLAGDGPAPAVVLIDSATERETPSDAARADLLGSIERSVSSLGVGSDAARARRTALAHITASAGHRVEVRCDTRALLIACAGPHRAEQVAHWQRFAGRLTVRGLDCGHYEVFQPAHQPVLLQHLDAFLSGLTPASGLTTAREEAHER